MIACAIAGLGRWGRSLVAAASTVTRLKITRAVETDLVRARPFCAEHDIATGAAYELAFGGALDDGRALRDGARHRSGVVTREWVGVAQQAAQSIR